MSLAEINQRAVAVSQRVTVETEQLMDRMDKLGSGDVSNPVLGMYLKRYETLTRLSDQVAVFTTAIEPLILCGANLPSTVALGATVAVWLMANGAVQPAMFAKVSAALDAVTEEARHFGVAVTRLKNAEAILSENEGALRTAQATAALQSAQAEGKLRTAQAEAEATKAAAYKELQEARATAKGKYGAAREREAQANAYATERRAKYDSLSWFGRTFRGLS
jgi:hypothetical protein